MFRVNFRLVSRLVWNQIIYLGFFFNFKSVTNTTKCREGMAEIAMDSSDAPGEENSDVLCFTPLGSGQEVGRSAHLLQFKGKKILVSIFQKTNLIIFDQRFFLISFQKKPFSWIVEFTPECTESMPCPSSISSISKISISCW